LLTANHLRNNLIEKLLTISNRDYLMALNKLIDSGNTTEETVKLSEEQILMLQMSENDIAAGKLISQSDLDKRDLECLKVL